jgi:hypothetical protein
MRKIKLLMGIVFLFVFGACVQRNTNIETVISDYDKTDFTNLKGKSIYIRNRDLHSITYFVNVFDGTCGPYIVEYSSNNNKIVSVRNNLVLSTRGKDFLTNNEIYAIVKIFAQYKLMLLQVDEDGNVYMNEASQGSPNLLRKVPNKSPKNISLFRHYRGNWYVRK